MVEKRAIEKGMCYYGEPTREAQEEIIGNIGRPMSVHGSKAVLCLRLRFEGMRIEENRLLFPNVCWEKTCNNEMTVIPQINQVEISHILNQMDNQLIPFGDFRQIIKMLKPKME